MDTPTAPQAGDLVAERFEIRELLRRCPTRLVYRAFDRDVEVEVALWWMRPALFPNAEVFGERVAEMKPLKHPHLVRLFDLASTEIGMVLSLQLGTSAELELALASAQPADLGNFLRYAEGLVSAVQAVHDMGRLQAWLAPGDIVEVGGQVKLCGAGLFADLDATTAVQAWGDHKRYLAPELLAGGPSSEASDWYSVAAILVDLATGCAHVSMEESTQRLQNMSPARWSALRPGIAEDPGERLSGVLLIDAIRQAWPDPLADALAEEEVNLPTVIDDQGRAEQVTPYDPRTPAHLLEAGEDVRAEDIGVHSFLDPEEDEETVVHQRALSPAPDADAIAEPTGPPASPKRPLQLHSAKEGAPKRATERKAEEHSPIRPVLRPLSSLAPQGAQMQNLGSFAPPKEAEGTRVRYWLYLLLAMVAGAACVSLVLLLGKKPNPDARPAEPVPAAPAPSTQSATLEADAAVATAHEALAPLDGQCPEGMVHLKDFCIDAHEAPGPGVMPALVETSEAAESLCAQRSARLCTSKEWELACRRQGKESWPYGNRFQEICNVDSGEIGLTGTWPACKSPAGVFDMSGNVAEWAGRGQIRGGSALDASKGRCSQLRSKQGQPAAEADIGYRCCADAIASGRSSD